MQIHPDASAEEAFGRAYEEYADAIFRHCYFHCGDREHARETMQEAFMKTWEYIAAGKSVENVRAFLYRTATNLLINAARRKKEASLEALQEQGFDPSVEEEWQLRDAVAEAKVIAVLKKLEEPYRQALTLRYIEGYAPAEIAELTGQTANVVSVRIFRGLKQLKSLLHAHG